MFREPSGKDSFLKNYAHYHSVYFVAEYSGQIVAFIIKADIYDIITAAE